LYAFNLADPIPAFALPLNPNDSAPTLDLQSILDEIYDRAGYSFRIDYQNPTVPALNPEDQQWANGLLTGGA
jgi:hypothetical protein